MVEYEPLNIIFKNASVHVRTYLTLHMYHICIYFAILSCRLVYYRQEVMATHHTNTIMVTQLHI